MHIVLSTRNPGKVEELKLGLDGLDVRIDTVESYPGFAEVDETESTLEGNAALKAEALFRYTGIPALADDTGLEVAALDGAPGVKSARYAGEECDPVLNRRHLLRVMANAKDRSARFRTVLAFTDEYGTRYFEGVCDGIILREERGHGGFGYDPIFQPEGSDLSFAELSSTEKNAISHRGRAIRSFLDFMRQYGKDG